MRFANPIRRTSPLLVLAAALAAASAGATTLAPLDEKTMARQAEAIVLGRVAGSRSEWVGRTLVTVATIRVEETLKGRKAGTVEVVLPGGVDAARRVPVAMTYPGAPRLLDSERVLLFLDDSDIRPDALIVSGYSQGKYAVARDTSGATVVVRSASDAHGAGSPHLHEGGSERRTLDQFRRQLRGYLAPTR